MNPNTFELLRALYEQIGDLAVQGNAQATTEAYQEARAADRGLLRTDPSMLTLRRLAFRSRTRAPMSRKELAEPFP